MSPWLESAAKMTSKQKLEAIRHVIDAEDRGQLWGPGAVEAMNALTGWNKVAYRKIFNKAFPKDTRCVESSDDGDTFVVWSWRKAVEGSNNLAEAMRTAVKPQMDAWRMMHPFDSCAECGAKEDLTVDHKDKPFDTIMRHYVAIHGSPQLYNNGTGAGWELDMQASGWVWASYHSDEATYQLLCRSCNSKKGTKC